MSGLPKLMALYYIPLLIAWVLLVCIATQIIEHVWVAFRARPYLEELKRAGRTIEWRDVLPRITEGTILIYHCTERFTSDEYPGCRLWWYQHHIKPGSNVRVSLQDAGERLILNYPWWAYWKFTLKFMCPNANVVYRRQMWIE